MRLARRRSRFGCDVPVSISVRTARPSLCHRSRRRILTQEPADRLIAAIERRRQVNPAFVHFQKSDLPVGELGVAADVYGRSAGRGVTRQVARQLHAELHAGAEVNTRGGSLKDLSGCLRIAKRPAWQLSAPARCVTYLSD